MKKFEFTLSQWLRQKEWKEEAAKKALAEEMRIAQQLQIDLEALKKNLQELLQFEPGQTFDINHRSNLLDYSRFLELCQTEQKHLVELQEKVVQEKSALLVLAMQERKVLEKLKERQYQAYRLSRNRFDTAALDESSAAFYKRSGLGVQISQG